MQSDTNGVPNSGVRADMASMEAGLRTEMADMKIELKEAVADNGNAIKRLEKGVKKKAETLLGRDIDIQMLK